MAGLLTNKDIRNLILIWVFGIGCSVVWAVYLAFFTYNPANEWIPPTPDTNTTYWIHGPATTVANMVRLNAAWTVAIITPFLFCPIFTLGYIVWRFSGKRNPRPATFHENLPLEVFWTVVPALVLVAMALPAYQVMRYIDTLPRNPDLVVEIVGQQFFWNYSYPRYGVEGLLDDETGMDPMVLPVNSTILLNGQATQVNHAWWVPAFGVKFDVIPGRTTAAWMRTTREGFFKGQCAELCGALHANMLVHARVVSQKEFYEWILKRGGTIPFMDRPRVEAILGRALPDDAIADEEVNETPELVREDVSA